MNRSTRLIALITIASAIAACSQAAGNIGDVPTASPTAVPSLAQSSPEPSPSPSDTAPAATTVPSAVPTSSPGATPSPTEPAIDPANVMAADGIGPYVVGAEMSELQSRGLISSVGSSFHCDDSWQYAGATGRYVDAVALTFHGSRVTHISTNSTEFVTPSGARIGMPLTELQSIYGNRGRIVNGTMGNKAFSVRVPDTDLGIVFFLDDTNTRSVWMSAGEVEQLEEFVVHGEGC